MKFDRGESQSSWVDIIVKLPKMKQFPKNIGNKFLYMEKKTNTKNTYKGPERKVRRETVPK